MPLFGKTAITLGGTSSVGSGVDRYDSSGGAAASNVCDHSGARVSMVTAADTRMCTHATPSLGAVATDGGLTLRSGDLVYFSRADIFNVPHPGYPAGSATGACIGDSNVCSLIGNKVFTHESVLDYPTSQLCSQGIGGGTTAYDGSLALAANTIYNFSDVTLNATAVTNLANVAGSQLVICFNGTLTVQPLAGINSEPAPDNALLRNPRPPSTLLLVSTAPSTTGPPPSVVFGAGLPGETSLSAVVYAPDATCTAPTGHVDVYGLLVCGSLDAPAGLDVHYDTQVGLMTTFDRPVQVSHWRELH